MESKEDLSLTKGNSNFDLDNNTKHAASAIPQLEFGTLSLQETKTLGSRTTFTNEAINNSNSADYTKDLPFTATGVAMTIALQAIQTNIATLAGLPTEILQKIFLLFNRHKGDIAHFARCSRRLYEIGNPILYESFDERHSESLSLFLRTILKNRSLAMRITTFRGMESPSRRDTHYDSSEYELRCKAIQDFNDRQVASHKHRSPAGPQFTSTCQDSASDLADAVLRRRWQAIAALTISLCPNIKQLTLLLRSWDSEYLKQVFRRAAIMPKIEHATSSQILGKLKVVDLNAGSPTRRFLSPGSTFYNILKIPGVRKVVIRNIHGFLTPEDSFPYQHWTGSIEELELIIGPHRSRYYESFASFCGCFPKLEKFVCSRLRSWGHVKLVFKMSGLKLLSGIQEFGSTLKELDLCDFEDVDINSFLLFQRTNGPDSKIFANMEKLETIRLTASSISLLGCQYAIRYGASRTAVPQYSLLGILPKTLKKLELLGCGFDKLDFDEIVRFEELLSCIDDQVPNLRDIRLLVAADAYESELKRSSAHALITKYNARGGAGMAMKVASKDEWRDFCDRKRCLEDFPDLPY